MVGRLDVIKWLYDFDKALERMEMEDRQWKEEVS